MNGLACQLEYLRIRNPFSTLTSMNARNATSALIHGTSGFKGSRQRPARLHPFTFMFAREAMTGMNFFDFQRDALHAVAAIITIV